MDAEFAKHKVKTEESDQKAKLEMLKMQSDAKKLYQSYQKVNEKSKQRQQHIDQLQDEIKGLRKKIKALEREKSKQVCMREREGSYALVDKTMCD